MNKLIFIVDDEKAISRLLTYWVKDKWKYEAEVFDNSEDALRKLHLKPDLILLDIMLPGLDGLATLKKLNNMMRTYPL